MTVQELRAAREDGETLAELAEERASARPTSSRNSSRPRRSSSLPTSRPGGSPRPRPTSSRRALSSASPRRSTRWATATGAAAAPPPTAAPGPTAVPGPMGAPGRPRRRAPPAPPDGSRTRSRGTTLRGGAPGRRRGSALVACRSGEYLTRSAPCPYARAPLHRDPARSPPPPAPDWAPTPAAPAGAPWSPSCSCTPGRPPSPRPTAGGRARGSRCGTCCSCQGLSPRPSGRSCSSPWPSCAAGGPASCRSSSRGATCTSCRPSRGSPSAGGS